MTKYKVTLYNTILQDFIVEQADDADDAMVQAQMGYGLSYPPYISDPSAWEIDNVQEVSE